MDLQLSKDELNFRLVTIDEWDDLLCGTGSLSNGDEMDSGFDLPRSKWYTRDRLVVDRTR